MRIVFGVDCVSSFSDCLPQRRNLAGILELHITARCTLTAKVYLPTILWSF